MNTTISSTDSSSRQTIEMTSQTKTALVTGSTSGIGVACVHALAKRGVNVVITGSRDESLVSGLIADIKGYGVRADYVQADLCQLAGVESLWLQVLQLYPDGIDILINNAGVLFVSPVETMSDEHWDQSIALMLSASFQLTKRCLPSMKKKGWGRIINVSSSLGFVGMLWSTAYLASKFGVIGLTKGVALECAGHGVTCNAVCPGCVETPMHHSECAAFAKATDMPVEDYQKSLMAEIPTGVLITSEQVAELVEFLCFSGASSQMTGASYLIDSGHTAK